MGLFSPGTERAAKSLVENMMRPSVARVAAVAPHMLMDKTSSNFPAPERSLKTAVDAATISFDAALTVESRNFASLVATPQAKNMITAFFFQLNQVNGGARRPKDPAKSSVAKLGVIGAGMMGQGIAHVAAKAGIPVALKDVSFDVAETGKAYTATPMDKQMARERANQSKKEQVLSLIAPSADDTDLAGCDRIVKTTEHQFAERAFGVRTRPLCRSRGLPKPRRLPKTL